MRDPGRWVRPSSWQKIREAHHVRVCCLKRGVSADGSLRSASQAMLNPKRMGEDLVHMFPQVFEWERGIVTENKNVWLENRRESVALESTVKLRMFEIWVPEKGGIQISI